jgi:hypothetical protein
VKRIARRVTPALLALMAGCAGPYDDPGTSTYVVGTIFLILGIVAGVALIMSLNEG